MRTNRRQYEPRSGELSEQSETKILEVIQEAYEKGFDDGMDSAREQFMQTQYLIFHTEGSA